MGVHGLTSYLREHKSFLSRTIQLPLPPHPGSGQGAESQECITVVLDGWSFIYEVVYCADLPWVYGGEYPRLSQVIQQVVNAWIEVGMDLHFVFDGPYPTLKFPTLVSRITQNYVQNGLLFFRTSVTARSNPRFLHETAMLPPLSYGVCVDTLVDLAAGAHQGKLHVHVADEEGDPYAVALAGRLNAYVAGRDSDFVVLNAEGYQGYIPLDEMVWTVTQTWDGEGSVYSVDTEADHDDGGFKPVRSSKSKKKRAGVHQRAGRGIIPPEEAQSPDAHLALSLNVYTPSTLASYLEIPVSLLPLLGALVGNDFTGSSDDSGPPPATTAEIRANRRANLQRLFFERQLTLGQRITRVANTLNDILAAAFGQSAAPHKKRAKKHIGSVMDLIDAAVTALLLRPLDTFATGEKEAIVERIVEATLQYAIPRPDDEVEDAEDITRGAAGDVLRWVSDVCPLHVAEACPLFLSLSRLVSPQETGSPDEATPSAHRATEDPHDIIRLNYTAAYRRGHFDPHILDAVQSGTMWPRLFLEDPDKECVERSVARPVREWTYAILDASVGLPVPPETGEEGDLEEEGDGDELVDVEEEGEDEDPLARLRGALKELDESDAGDGESAGERPPPSVLSASTALTRSQPKLVTEYIRRGTRLAAEEVTVRPLVDMLHELSWESPVHSQTALPIPPPLWPEDMRRKLLLAALGSDCPAVASLPDHSLLAVLAVRFVVRQMHLRALASPTVKERQLERWTQAEARAFLACISSQHAEPVADTASPAHKQDSEAIPIAERHVQLVAQISAALEAIEQLSHVLLLTPGIPSPARRFAGSEFHALLGGSGPLTEEPEEAMWRACLEGLEDAYVVLPQKKSKKDKKAKTSPEVVGPVRTKGPQPVVSKGGMFGLLADAEA
ncbi:PIN domain-like protein [Pilatotrama ljubarskyi]|nr:PIN domain-like protein [Pilatotrama ljubarskyi]